jgi:hypothetical protein
MLANACNPTRGISTISSNILSQIPTAITALQAGKISLVPNPAHDKFEVLNANTGEQIKSLILFDQLGNRISPPYSITGAGRISVDISQLASGLYYVVLNYENSSAAARVVKQ